MTAKFISLVDIDSASRSHLPKAANDSPAEGVILQCIADVEARPVEWQWRNRLARRKLTLVAGDPGLGKSQISLDVAARISRGERWPDEGQAPGGRTLILSAEDGAADTLRPRLEAAGADLRMVHTLNGVIQDGKRRSFSLQADLDRLGAELAGVGDASLMIIDPITSYMGNVDSHRSTDVRAVLEPLARFAETYNVAVLAVSHPPKAAQVKAIHAITGSLAFVAAARLVFLVTEEPDTGRRLLLPVKNNIGQLAPGLGYRVAQTTVSHGIVAPHVLWDSAPVEITANQAIAATSEPRPSGAFQDAIAFLRCALASGPMSASDAEAQAAEKGISLRTLDRGRKALGVRAGKEGFRGPWQWRLPTDDGGRQT